MDLGLWTLWEDHVEATHFIPCENLGNFIPASLFFFPGTTWLITITEISVEDTGPELNSNFLDVSMNIAVKG